MFLSNMLIMLHYVVELCLSQIRDVKESACLSNIKIIKFTKCFIGMSDMHVYIGHGYKLAHNLDCTMLANFR